MAATSLLPIIFLIPIKRWGKLNLRGKATKRSESRFSLFTLFLLLLNARSCFHFLLLQHISKNNFLYFKRYYLFSAFEKLIILLKVETLRERLCKITLIYQFRKNIDLKLLVNCHLGLVASKNTALFVRSLVIGSLIDITH